MPEEAVAWTNRMVNYTVSGGKMNRGLAVMSAHSILAKAKGKTLSIKVFFLSNCPIIILLIG
jgi:hypothetical protein